MAVLIRHESLQKGLTNLPFELDDLTGSNIAKVKKFLALDKHFIPMLESDRSLSMSLLRTWEANALVKSALSGGFCQILTHEGDICGVAIAEKSAFDTQNFGFGVGRIKTLSVREDLVREQASQARNLLIKLSEDWMKQNDVKCVIARIDLNDVEGILALERNWFATFDILATFNAHSEGGCADKRHLPSNAEVRSARSDDEPTLMRIAREGFKYDHFHRDPNFAKQQCNELYAKWVHNCINGLADAVLVATERSKFPVGFITCKITRGKQNGYGVIDLVAVSPTRMNNGLGRLLITEACRWFFRNGIRSILVGTQANNVSAVRIYENCGFRLVSTEMTFHKWLDDSQWRMF